MSTKILRRRVSTLSQAQINRLASLTFRENGFMAYEVRHLRKQKNKNAWAYWIEDVDTHQILSWALVFPTQYWQRDKYQNITGVYFYTRAAFRKKGYTRRLWKQIRKHHAEHIQLYPHNEGSQAWADKLKKGDRRVRSW